MKIYKNNYHYRHHRHVYMLIANEKVREDREAKWTDRRVDNACNRITGSC